MKIQTIAAVLALLSSAAYAGETEIVGNVQSKCSIFTETQGVYGAPLPSQLSTDAADGGVQPRIRFDIASAGYYKAKISTPTSFSTSPSLTDSVAWEGSVSVEEVTDPAMSVFETNKVQYDNVTEFDLSAAGTVWFSASSKADYGFGKSFPGGQYKSIVTAECIAK